jgi:hypothetical protein
MTASGQKAEDKYNNANIPASHQKLPIMEK